MTKHKRPRTITCPLCGHEAHYFGSFSDAEMDCYDPAGPSMMVRYLCMKMDGGCGTSIEITTLRANITGRPESQRVKDAMVGSKVAEMLTRDGIPGFSKHDLR